MCLYQSAYIIHDTLYEFKPSEIDAFETGDKRRSKYQANPLPLVWLLAVDGDRLHLKQLYGNAAEFVEV